MRTIHKYVLQSPEQAIQMPRGAELLAVQVQNDQICLWAEVDTGQPMEFRVFYVVGTGHELKRCDMTYVATVQQPPFVWHVYTVEMPRP